MERGLGLEERTHRLLLRSEALLSRSPAPPRPRPGPAPSDPLLQWRRRRGAGPGGDTPPWGGASPASRDPPRRGGSQDALRPEEEGAWGRPSWRSRDRPEPWQPEGEGSHDALRRLSQKALRPPSPLPPAPWGRDVGLDEAVNDLQQEPGPWRRCWQPCPPRGRSGSDVTTHPPRNYNSHHAPLATPPSQSLSQDGGPLPDRGSHHALCPKMAAGPGKLPLPPCLAPRRGLLVPKMAASFRTTSPIVPCASCRRHYPVQDGGWPAKLQLPSCLAPPRTLVACQYGGLLPGLQLPSCPASQ